MTPVSAGEVLMAGRTVVDPALAPYVATSGLSGRIVIAGSDTMQPLLVKVAAAFTQWHPDVKIAVQGGGTESAVMQFLQDQAAFRRGDGNVKGHLVSGHITLLAASRPLTEREREGFRARYGYDVLEIPIALDAIAVLVHHQNPIEGLTLEQVDAIFSKERRRGAPLAITTWGHLGLKDQWALQPIHPYGLNHHSGTRALFIQELLLGGGLREGVREEAGAALEMLAISRDPLGIGYAGVGFRASTVRFVPIAERAGAPFVSPSVEAVTNRAYPLTRLLYLYARANPGAGLEPEVREFLTFINSRDGQEVLTKAGAYPLPATLINQNLQALRGVKVVHTTLAR
jgi:phosphate transport system substrate-binding protein